MKETSLHRLNVVKNYMHRFCKTAIDCGQLFQGVISVSSGNEAPGGNSQGVHGLICLGMPVQGCKQKCRLPLKKVIILPLAGKKVQCSGNVRIIKNTIARLKIMVGFVAAKIFSKENGFCKPIAIRKKSNGFSDLMLR